jgi:putative heme-binding domain-containing protein
MVWPGSGQASQPHVSMLVPGFTVRELPVRLSNVNNLRFTPDGKLTALGYDGRIHILRDTDGDGLEDEATVFWDKPTLSVPVGMAWSREGLYVSSHGKVSRLRDADGDGKADEEEIVANEWPPTDVASGGVDATAVTLDPDGNVYFGLLTADYSNPYRVTDGTAHYDLQGRRGTIQKWSRSTRALETLATGIRVPYTLAFNRHGDLFVTDQEGETWCPGGNPLDELNHVISGRNYGFPPRHEKYLPDLVSEPPVVAFAPQHQSACGLVFNESKRDQRRFGPPAWEGDAFVAGESRGKIWRVRLVKTPTGYIGKETLVARLDMLTTDVAISPGGDLYVSCHSGNPDWGTGPNGDGKLFKISYSPEAEAPQPVAAWAAGSMELRVAFGRPIEPDITRRPDGVEIEFGEYVSAADRLEVLKPPYKVVGEQESSPRGRLKVIAARLDADQRTLILSTDPHPQSVSYALSLPDVRAAGSAASPARVDLAYNLAGVEATWSGAAHPPAASWSGWLPHLDWEVNQAFLAGSAGHARLFDAVRRKGVLQLRSQLSHPRGANQIRIEASRPFELTSGPGTAESRAVSTGANVLETAVEPGDQPQPVTLRLATGSPIPLKLHASWSTPSDPTWRPMPSSAFLLPWAPPYRRPVPAPAPAYDLAGGDYERGRDLFFGDRLKCSTCHRLRGPGPTIGPDLSNLVHRDPASVFRDVSEPSVSINPDYVAYNVELRDGSGITGFARLQSADSLRVVGADAKEQIIPRSEVKEMRPSSVSLMPAGLIEGLGAGQVRDLLTFLLHAPPVRAARAIEGVQRRDRGVESAGAGPVRALNVVLVAGKQDHGPGQHDYPAWQKKWMDLLGNAAAVKVSEARDWPTPKQFREADVLVFYFWNHDWNPERLGQLDACLERGGGLVFFHSATIADKDPELLALRIGLAAQPGPTKYLHTPFVLKFLAPTNHPIARGFTTLDLLDEPYWPMIGDTNRIEILASADIEGEARPLVWTFRKGNGRVFASVPGHYSWTFEDPLFRILALRGLAWAAGESTGRLEGP